ncbi:plasmid stabilization protein [Mesorhizobium sp. B2-5-4]|uniref:plasmid stabilization protein n=1 Tax=unclassified Mesorhizobium TaxID=325217 RepID=UPI001125DB3C|nr:MULTISPECIES: plasmid stabilization protein [unclassified Mesorhizobium]TPJ45088.1 plasmid stabilization protein [Mesorhizobium sp. B2-6-5]TPJ91541.1 plasmid stabilization protein [Mesorhizobium sp. B2-5-13]TPK48699.1 plasmid stabilization protein [Mesorhizobium sp. B2-5-4]TPK50083.1 plasmid stabilization protein [Mesorhizobium sp. B2-5-5]TPL79494.1 plasmid stabilization protein [Mesorhizobium sp. B2-3-13]
MGDMLIRDIPEPLKREIEQAARSGGQSLSGKAIDLLRKGMVAEKEAKPEPGLSAWDNIRSAFATENAIDDEFAEIMDEIEADRKRDFGRPAEDFE